MWYAIMRLDGWGDRDCAAAVSARNAVRPTASAEMCHQPLTLHGGIC
jgi:hypothetical protein